jgi:uncharacterized membrane protein
MTSGAPTTRWAMFARLLRDRDGFVMVMVAILLPVLIGFAGLAAETGLWYAIKRQNQSAADEAAISGAMEVAAGKPGNVTTLATRDAVRNGFVTPHSRAARPIRRAAARSPGRSICRRQISPTAGTAAQHARCLLQASQITFSGSSTLNASQCGADGVTTPSNLTGAVALAE